MTRQSTGCLNCLPYLQENSSIRQSSSRLKCAFRISPEPQAVCPPYQQQAHILPWGLNQLLPHKIIQSPRNPSIVRKAHTRPLHPTEQCCEATSTSLKALSARGRETAMQRVSWITMMVRNQSPRKMALRRMPGLCLTNRISASRRSVSTRSGVTDLTLGDIVVGRTLQDERNHTHRLWGWSRTLLCDDLQSIEKRRGSNTIFLAL